MVVACVGAIIVDEEGRLLLVRLGRPPGEGLWSLPGGRVEPGECDAAAVAREVLEETGLRVSVGRLVGRVDRPGPDGVTFRIADYRCTQPEGDLAPGDDAAEVRWVRPGELATVPLTPGLVAALVEWKVLPRG